MVLCTIRFDNAQKIYYAGQNVSGTFELPFEKTKMIQYLSVKIEGYASCKFYVKEGKSNTTYHAKEKYLSSIVYLVGSVQGQPVELIAGLHTYRFSCLLPGSLPTSFEGSNGKIRYNCIVSLDRPWTLKSTQKSAFTVINQLDLNLQSPAIRQPNKQEVTKTYSFGFSKSREIYMSMELQTTGFVAGQKIEVVIDINNSSDVSVDFIKLSLKKSVSYKATKPRKFTKEKVEPIEVKRSPGVEKRGKKTFNMTLVIPATPPSNQGICNIITINYEVAVKAKVANTLHRSAKINIPIIIGTIPINQQIGWQSTSLVTTQPYASTSTFHGQDLPPPTYEEVIMMANPEEQEDKEDKDDIFSPRYPVYHFDDTLPSYNDRFVSDTENGLQKTKPSKSDFV